VIDRASSTDRAFLAMDTGTVPEQFGALLLLDDDGLDLSQTRALLGERVAAVPRLRQKLVRVPFGCGGPIWADDASFDIDRQVRAVTCRQPGDEQALLDTVLELVMQPLPRNAPLWSATLVTGLAGRRTALTIVLHHVLADGVGGLSILAGLMDPGGEARDLGFPRPQPAVWALASNALLERLRGLRRCAQTWRLLRASLAGSGGLRPPAAAPCSLLERTGPRRRAAVVRTDLKALSVAAHRRGATVNDALLVAVAGALHRVLLQRGEYVDTFALAVPVSGRQRGSQPQPGNLVSPMLVHVPATGAAAGRLDRVAADVRALKAASSGPPPIALLGWLFRPLARLGGYRWYMNHQHRLHTLVSHVRGPGEPVTFGGSRIAEAVPVAVGEGGNMPVYFEAMSYAGTLTITVIVDPENLPESAELVDALHAELAQVKHA